MRLFGAFKFIEAYLIICAILLLYSFQKLCKHEEITDLEDYLKQQGYIRVNEYVLLKLAPTKIYENEWLTDAVDRGPLDLPRDSSASNKSPVRGELNDDDVTLPPHEDIVTDKYSRMKKNRPEPVLAQTVVVEPVNKDSEFAEEVEGSHHESYSSSNARQRRNVIKPNELWTKQPVIANQTHTGVFRCEQDAGWSFQSWWNGANVYQTLFTKRFYAMGFLVLHLLFIIYHCIVNITHRIPTSQRFNRIFAAIGLIIWGLIDIWILYHYFTWRSEFEHVPVVPSFPDELIIFAIISIAMIALLIYELVTPVTIITSYDLSPRHPRMGYAPAAQSENEYISGIINQLETSQGSTSLSSS